MAYLLISPELTDAERSLWSHFVSSLRVHPWDGSCITHQVAPACAHAKTLDISFL